MLESLFKRKKIFKLICGAGKEDPEEVKRLVYIYSLAGCRFFDLSPNEEVLKNAQKAVELSNISDVKFCVSIGLKDDPHVQKAQIDSEKCKKCGKCEEICPENAIKYFKVKQVKCIGCSKCSKICNQKAISFKSCPKELNKVIPPIMDLGVDCVELHAMGSEDKEVLEQWNYLNSNFSGMLSICTSRGNLSDNKLITRIKTMISKRKPYSTIIQADGFPMSGGNDDFKTTLQSVATAEIIQNANLPVYLMLSGGTNSKTAQLAKMCDINYDGIAIGSFARKIVREFIVSDDFWNNKSKINEAVQIASKLVQSVK